MAPPLASSAAADRLAAQDADARAPLKDWKALIDNGLAGGGQQVPARQNRTAPTDDSPSALVPASGSNMIPLYCGLLGTVICALVLWIVWKHARSRGRDAKLQPPSAADTAASAPLAPASAEADGDDNGDIAEAVGRRWLCDLSEARMRRLEQMLDKGSGWKALAAEMGYQPDAVAELESRAGLASASAASLLLRDWEAAAAEPHGTGATVGDLRRRLQAAGLEDALACLRDSAGSAGAASSSERKRRHRPVTVAASAEAAAAAPTTAEGGLPVELTIV